MKQSRVSSSEQVVGDEQTRDIKRQNTGGSGGAGGGRHQPKVISSSQYLDSCGHSSSSSTSSSTSSCCSSSSSSSSSDKNHQRTLPMTVSPGPAVMPSMPSTPTSRQQQRRRSWLLGSLNTTTTTTSCGPLTTSQEEEEEEEEEENLKHQHEVEEELETPRSTPFSLASSTPTQQLFGVHSSAGTILEEEAGPSSGAPARSDSEGEGQEEEEEEPNNGETGWLLAEHSAPSSHPSSSSSSSSSSSTDGEDISTSSHSSSSSSSSSLPSLSISQNQRHRKAKKTKRSGKRACFWRLVASSTSGSDSQSTAGSGDDDDNDDRDNCDTNTCDKEQDQRAATEHRETSSCPLQDLFDYSQESNPNNRPRLVLPGSHLPLGNQLWRQQQHLNHQHNQQREFMSSPLLGVHHPTLARLNSIHEDNHEQEAISTTCASNDNFKVTVAASSSSSSPSPLPTDNVVDGEQPSELIRPGDHNDERIAGVQHNEDNEEEEEEEGEGEHSEQDSSAGEEVELGQVNRGGGGGGRQSDDENDGQDDDDDDDDDDYFYDEELSFNQQHHRLVGGVACAARIPPTTSAGRSFQRPSIPTAESPAAWAQVGPTIPATTPTLTANDLVARLSTAPGGACRPLFVWAPTARRTSCPVGQLTSFASWRQLWPAQPPLPATSNQAHQQQQQQPVLCSNCTNQQATTTATNSPILWSESQPPQHQHQQPPGLATVKSSRTSLACSDYFSSFDQGDTQPAAQPYQSSSLRRRLGGCGGANPMQPGDGRSNGNTMAELPPLELRRQSTITGFDHHRYTAPRSPSLCLPHVVHHPVHGRSGNHLLTASNAGGGGGPPSTSSLGPPPLSASNVTSSSRLLLSPTHSTGGSSSPSPTGWHHQNAAALAAIAIAQQQQQQQQQANQQQLVHAMHRTAGNHQQPPVAMLGRNQFGRNRLESLESDRGSSPSWSASTSSLRSSIGGGGNSIYSALAIQQQQQRKRSSGSICSTASSSGVHSLASTTSGGASCPACQQLQAVAAASKCTMRSHLAQGAKQQQHQQQPQCGAQLLRQLREEALEGAKLGPSLYPLSATAFRPFGQSLQNSQQVGAGRSLLQAANGQQQSSMTQQQQQQQEQAVYFFLCCCQRNGSKKDGESSSSPTTSQAAAADGENENVNRPRAGSTQQQQQQPQPQQQQPQHQQQHLRPQEPSERRVSLVARPAIVGAPDPSPVAGTSGTQQRQARRSTAGLGSCPSEGSKSLTSRDSTSGQQQQQQQQQHELPQGMAVGVGPVGEPRTANSKHGARDEQTEETNGEGQAGEGEGDQRQIPKTATVPIRDRNQDDLRGQLSALLNQLDGYQRQGRQLGAGERELLAALSQRVSSVIGVEGACLVDSTRERTTEVGPLAVVASANATISTNQAASTDRANMMRYSTPNLLLSSNFELLLRQQDRRKQEQSDQETAEQEGPPEATEAWFLSRSPTSSQTGGGGPSGTAASRNQRGSRESIRLRALESIATVASGKVVVAPQGQPSGGAPTAVTQQQQQQQFQLQRQLDTQGAGPAGPEVSTSSGPTETASWQTRQVLDQHQRHTGTGGSCQSASDGICKEQTFDETPEQQQQQRPPVGQAPIVVEQGQAAGEDDDHANPISRRQRDAANREAVGPGGSHGRSDATAAAATAGQPRRVPAPGEQVADGGGGGGASGRAPSSPALIGHDKSMAQARYLYSTLTSNAGALLASTGGGGGGGSTTSAQASSSASTSQAKPTAAPAAPAAGTTTTNQQQQQRPQASPSASGTASAASANKSSVSPTRSTGPQRKQAQFVAQQRERQLRELQQQRQQQQQQQLAGGGTDSKLIGLSPASSPSRATSPARRQSAGRKTKSTRRQGGQGGGGDDDDDEGSGSGGDSDDDGGAHSPAAPVSPPLDRPIRDEEPRAGEDIGEPAPAIIESVCEQRRRSSQSSNSGALGGSGLEQQHQQQLQPMSMDPEMHALWAQGADLDTGNGNFIQATRRRRSVHAIHQVQLHQALQQQQQHQQQQHHQVSGGKLATGPSLAHDRRSQQLTAVDLQPGTSGGGGGRLTAGAVDSSRKLKDKLRKLRSSSSIEETQYRAARRSQQLSGAARARFVSDPSAGGSSGGGGGGGHLSGGRSSELHAAPPGVEMGEEQAIQFDDELEAAAAAAAAAAEELNLEAASDILAKPSLVEEEEEEEEEDEELELEDDERIAKLREAGEEAADQEEEERRVCLSNGKLEYDLDELESSESMLANLFQWNYPIFELAEKYDQSILSKLSYRIFYDSGFFESFKIPKRAFFNFFNALEEGYLDKPYHNRLHAADVLHAVYYLTSQPIGNFCQVPLDLIELYDNLLATTKPDSNRLALELSRRTRSRATICQSNEPNRAADNQQQQQQQQADGDEESQGDEFVSKLHNHIVAIVVAAAAAAADSELPFGIMGANLTALEVMALYTAAAMHDFQHPGRTNSFLVATNSPLALLYNDRSVLENHHSAAAWALFYSGSGYDWLCNLEKDEFKRFRFMIIELILATDLMRHYELVSAFNKKLHNVGRHNIDWFCESDRLLVMEIIIKLADVNGPMKGHHLHCQWTDRIAMEFYEQGDEERARNLPVSLYMDRSDPRLPELQKSFINHLVGPLSHSYAAAGFFPKSSEPEMLASAGAIARAAMVDDHQDSSSSSSSSSSQQQQHRNDQTESQNCEDEAPPTQSESVYNQTKYWLIDNSPEGRKKLNKQFLECIQTMNLRDNFLYWDAKSREKQQQQQQQQMQQMQQNSRKLS